MRSPSGRRLYIEGDADDVIATNVLALVVDAGRLAASPSASPRLPVGRGDGARLTRGRRGRVLRLTEHASRRMAGNRVQVGCWEAGGHGAAATLRAPRRGRTVGLFGTDFGGDYCHVWLTARRTETLLATMPRLVAGVPLTRRGAGHLAEERTSLDLLGLLERAERTRGGRQRFVRSRRLVDALHALGSRPLEALPSPAAMPPPGTLGYYGDGAASAAAVGVAATGRRLFVEAGPDDAVRTNVLPYVLSIELEPLTGPGRR
jgi:hypothetical protein